ncbi:hypothetical protein DSOUD_2354 [Desulfuromonas soudanensis]|uniref:DUF11 domain-containing protein n=1 Tax=Desulfuromonas soudanensis TaxID=1603606 RepID=A0A0M4D1U7_9BACT|nr:hypothetical protein [Desulfuromonas soudanensis]ALC17115.1 hypothetical protein DSOUD_2354 [Desulfuromonas soudanensis]
MNSRQQNRRGLFIATLITALALIALTTGSAFAALSAGTTISNQASVTYAESATAVASNIVDVTVNLVSGLAWLDGTLSPATDTVGNGGAVSYTVDLQNTGNGTTTATITDGTTQVLASLGAGSWNIAPNAPVLVGAISSGAGVYDGTVTTIPVSNLATGSLVVGTTRVLINGNEYLVAAGSTATQLVVTGDATAVAGAAGVQIGEVVSITFSGTAGTLIAPDLDENHVHAMTATDEFGVSGFNADGNAFSTDTTTAWNTRVVAGALTVTKYSRNVSNAVVGGIPLVYGGNTYYQSGVTGNSAFGAVPADTLEYLVVIENAGPGSATDVQMSDSISTFLALDTASVDIDTNGDGTFDVVDAAANDAAAYSAPTLTVYAGVGGVASTTTGGSVAAAASTAIRYQAAIQ